MKKILASAIAAALFTPLASYADVNLSGTIQFEMTGAEVGDADDFERVSKDADGAVFNEGPNLLTVDVEEQLGNGLNAIGRFQGTFSTASNGGLDGYESWVGLKGQAALLRFGTLGGNYKSTVGDIDPFFETSLQARGTAGGMSGDAYNTADGKQETNAAGNGLATNNGLLENALELGAMFGGFSINFQGVFDETDKLDGAGLVELKYTGSNFSVFAAAAYADFSLESLEDTVEDNEDADSNDSNWKLGGTYTINTLKVGAQYEHAQLGAFDGLEGDYGMLSVDYGIGNLNLGAWVGGYFADADDEDAVSGAIGAKYNFSNRTMAFLGYRMTDSDNDVRDEDVFSVGLRHSF